MVLQTPGLHILSTYLSVGSKSSAVCSGNTGHYVPCKTRATGKGPKHYTKDNRRHKKIWHEEKIDQHDLAKKKKKIQIIELNRSKYSKTLRLQFVDLLKFGKYNLNECVSRVTEASPLIQGKNGTDDINEALGVFSLSLSLATRLSTSATSGWFIVQMLFG